MKRNMKQWVQEVLDAPVKRAMPVLSFPAIQLMDITVRDLISSSDLQSKGMKMVADRVPAAAAVSLMDLSVEAECFGSQIRFSDDEVPTVVGALVSSAEEVDALKVPAVGAGRTGIYIESIEKAMKLIEDRPVFAGVIGPFSLAGRLMDVTEAMIYCYEEPEMVSALMDKVTEFLIAYCSAYKQVGANGVVLAEPLAGLLSPALAEEYGATYTSSDEMTYSSTYVYGDWFFDESRAAGDAEVLEDTNYSRYFVAVFHGRKQDTTLDYSVRHILITEDSLELAEGEEATDEMVLAKAQEILDSWDGTEEGFAELAKEYSKDGNAAEGGLYENVAKGAMVSEFEDWCYEPGRKSGDTGIVKTSYGEHIMYFVGYGDTPYWYYACNNALVSNAYTEWQTETTDSVTAEVNEAGMAMIG